MAELTFVSDLLSKKMTRKLTCHRHVHFQQSHDVEWHPECVVKNQQESRWNFPASELAANLWTSSHFEPLSAKICRCLSRLRLYTPQAGTSQCLISETKRGHWRNTLHECNEHSLKGKEENAYLELIMRKPVNLTHVWEKEFTSDLLSGVFKKNLLTHVYVSVNHSFLIIIHYHATSEKNAPSADHTHIGTATVEIATCAV